MFGTQLAGSHVDKMQWLSQRARECFDWLGLDFPWLQVAGPPRPSPRPLGKKRGRRASTVNISSPPRDPRWPDGRAVRFYHQRGRHDPEISYA